MSKNFRRGQAEGYFEFLTKGRNKKRSDCWSIELWSRQFFILKYKFRIEKVSEETIQKKIFWTIFDCRKSQIFSKKVLKKIKITVSVITVFRKVFTFNTLPEDE